MIDEFILYAIHVLVIGRWLYCEYCDWMAKRIIKRFTDSGLNEVGEAIRKNIR